MIDDLLANPAPELPLPSNELQDLMSTHDNAPPDDLAHSKLKSLLGKLLRSSRGHYQKTYVGDLQKSLKALLANSPPSLHISDSPYALLKQHLEQCKENVDSLYKKITSKLVIVSSPIYESARRASLLPRLSSSILLRLLARFSPAKVSVEWQCALTRYALGVSSMQRARRLVACGKRDVDILNELTNAGHSNCDPMEYPEWLLLEVERSAYSPYFFKPQLSSAPWLPLLRMLTSLKQ
jgi:hypothetical protein